MSESKPRGRAMLETLGSVKLGVALMVAAAAASVLGTVVLQTSLPGGDPATLQGAYGGLAKTLILLGLTDVFHATWYAVLLALLALNLACATARCFAPRMEKIGMFLAHAGILVTLAGGLVYSLLGDKGVVTIGEGDTADKYLSRRDGRYKPLPFALHLKRFAAERTPARMLFVGPRGQAVAAAAKAGDEVALPWTSARVTFERVIPEAERVFAMREDENAPMNPAARLKLETAEGVTEFWRFAARASPAETLLHNNGRIAVAYDNESTLRANDLPAEPRAYAVNRETARAVEIPCKAGQSFPLPNANTPAEGEIVSVLDDADNSSLGPCLRIQLHADNQTAWRHAFAKLPRFSPEAAAGLPTVLPELDVIYYRPKLSFRVTRIDDLLDRRAPARFRVQWWLNFGDGRRVDDVMTGEQAGPPGTAVTVLESLQRARVDVRYEPSAGKTGTEAALVRVSWPDGPPRRFWLSTTGSDHIVRVAEGLALAYAAGGDVREFVGEVVLGDPGVPAVLRVNRPADFGGWQVFLESGDPEATPPACALVVSRDPGLPLVSAGLVLLALGAFWACFVRSRRGVATSRNRTTMRAMDSRSFPATR